MFAIIQNVAVKLFYVCTRPLNALFYVSPTKCKSFFNHHEINIILKRLSHFPNVTQLVKDRTRI